MGAKLYNNLLIKVRNAENGKDLFIVFIHSYKIGN